ncbi:hypothetical protein NW768_004394 [Fusarium equiseti]|uniref:Uncharacterized protein n=1 Tax=Fusarium equiseti TaxID=61235 RepID=A0ABQ8RG63_FUSEQ|nr:hypothetical protein NW768_004394 [Fusarium equiseti]
MSRDIKDQERVDVLAEKRNALLAIAIGAESPKPRSRDWYRTTYCPTATQNLADDEGRRASEVSGRRFTDSDGETEYQDVLGSRFDSMNHDKLKELHTQIVAKLRAPPIGDIPNLRPGITPQKHQMYAVGKVELAMISQLKGMILLDPLVTPLSCFQQRMKEIKKFFNEDSMSAFRLARDRANVDAIFCYKIIATTYHQVSAELGSYRQSYKRI